ncbi:putative transcriptional regulatory protein [Cladorrhinum sp. PSN259]|nr:putative transcriptional regulatory protein [Cladorrhinum sp. PSN259]
MTAEQPPENHQPPSPPRLTGPGPGPGLEPSVMKLTRGHSCVLCQQRKVRCDKQKPCANCIKANVECRVVPPQPPRRRKKKPHERDLIERLRKYEALMSQAGVNFEPIAHELKPSDIGDDVADLEQDLSGLKTSPSSAADHVSPPEQTNDKSKWYNTYYKEYRALDDESSDEDYEGPTLHHAYDTMFDNNDGFPFVVGGGVASVTNSHPPAIQIFQLWQIYISNVNPLLGLLHVPTLQAQIISAGTATNKIAPPMEALMFAIYFAAVTSMSEEDVQSAFAEDKAILLNKFHGATQQALVNAGFMRSTDIMALQALFLYLLCVRQYVDPRSLFCLIGLAIRIATRLGIHRDGSQYSLSPFDAELRRRLWWQLVIFDKRVAEITGSSITALSTCDSDCRAPLNINDTDLSIHAKDPPIPSHGPTEQIFVLTRIELTVASTSSNGNNARHSVTTSPGGKTVINNTRVQYSPSPSSPDVVTHVANQTLPHDLASFNLHMENIYLRNCDSKIPLHLFTILMTRQALCKLRVIDFLSRSRLSDNMDPNERHQVFIEAIRTVEYDNVIQSTESLQCYRWYTYQHFPFPAYIFLISELRTRTTGELCERAWGVMIENHERRGMMRRNFRSPLHIAFGHFFVKAWDAREQAELQLGRVLPTPNVVSFLRNSSSKWKRPTPPAPAAAMNGRGDPRPSEIPPVSGSSKAPQQPPPMAGPPSGGPPPSMNMYPPVSKPVPEPTSVPATRLGGAAPAPAPNMMMDDSTMFNTFDNMSQVFPNVPGQPTAGIQEDFGQMDWNYLVQYGSFGGFNPGYYQHGNGTAHP